jgi:hypothetical protein
MGGRVRHKKVSSKAPTSDESILDSTDWNNDHDMASVSRTVTTTTDTILATDNLGLVKYTNTATTTVTLPNSLPVDFTTDALRYGGPVNFVLESAATARPTGLTGIDTQDQWASLTVVKQGGSHSAGATGTTAEWNISGSVS